MLETKAGMSKVEGVSKQRDNGNWAAQEGLGRQLAATPGVRSEGPGGELATQALPTFPKCHSNRRR